MNKSNFDVIVSSRLVASDFAQPAKKTLFARVWRKLCVVKTA